VIVVDDEPLVGRSIRRALRGHDVEVFASGAAAVERLSDEEPFDVVFCDLMMPEVSGMEVYRRVTERRPERASRFVFMTGGAFTPKARDFLAQTPLPCLEKPFELRQIRDLVAERAGPAD
jgi:CheY-like chemotaxis protein